MTTKKDKGKLANTGTQSHQQRGGITAGNIQAETVIAGDVENINQIGTKSSSSQEIINLLEEMVKKLQELNVPDKEKNKAKPFIESALVEAKSDKPEKRSIADSLEQAGKILDGASTTALKATAFGQLLSQGLIWTGKAIGWL